LYVEQQLHSTSEKTDSCRSGLVSLNSRRTDLGLFHLLATRLTQQQPVDDQQCVPFRLILKEHTPSAIAFWRSVLLLSEPRLTFFVFLPRLPCCCHLSLHPSSPTHLTPAIPFPTPSKTSVGTVLNLGPTCTNCTAHAAATQAYLEAKEATDDWAVVKTYVNQTGPFSL
jgi:hypothetical protein